MIRSGSYQWLRPGARTLFTLRAPSVPCWCPPACSARVAKGNRLRDQHRGRASVRRFPPLVGCRVHLHYPAWLRVPRPSAIRTRCRSPPGVLLYTEGASRANVAEPQRALGLSRASAGAHGGCASARSSCLNPHRRSRPRRAGGAARLLLRGEHRLSRRILHGFPEDRLDGPLPHWRGPGIARRDS